jgi:hypothetical protein
MWWSSQKNSSPLSWLFVMRKTALHCGQGTVRPSNPTATGTTTTSTTSSDSTDEATTTNSTIRSLPLHWNNKYIDFEKLAEFDLNFSSSFSYKINEFGTKTERESCEATRQAESRATKKIVTAILAAGDNDQQRALALHGSFLDERTRKIGKSAGFMLDRMEAVSYQHWDQLKKLV